MQYLLIGLMSSVGWHIGKLVYKLIEEIIFNRLHSTEWYAVLCKKAGKKIIQDKNSCKPNNPYRQTTLGFRAL